MQVPRPLSVRLLAQLAGAEVVGPLESQVKDRPGGVLLRGCVQAAAKHVALRRLVVDCAKRQAEGVRHEAGKRRFYQCRDLRHLGDRDGRQAVIVEDSLEQSDRLLADRSGRHEQDQVHVSLH